MGHKHLVSHSGLLMLVHFPKMERGYIYKWMYLVQTDVFVRKTGGLLPGMVFLEN